MVIHLGVSSSMMGLALQTGLMTYEDEGGEWLWHPSILEGCRILMPLTYIEPTRGVTGLDIYFDNAGTYSKLLLSWEKQAPYHWYKVDPAVLGFTASEAISNTEQNADAESGFPRHQWNWRWGWTWTFPASNLGPSEPRNRWNTGKVVSL